MKHTLEYIDNVNPKLESIRIIFNGVCNSAYNTLYESDDKQNL